MVIELLDDVLAHLVSHEGAQRDERQRIPAVAGRGVSDQDLAPPASIPPSRSISSSAATQRSQKVG